MSKKILMVDDDVDIIEQYRPALEKAGYMVEAGHDSVEGFEKFKEFQPDVVFVDLAMEHFDSGFVLCHRIKSTEEGKKTPVYILTSAGHETGFRFSTDTSEEKRWIKADGYLEKPIPAADLIQFLKEKVFKAE